MEPLEFKHQNTALKRPLRREKSDHPVTSAVLPATKGLKLKGEKKLKMVTIFCRSKKIIYQTCFECIKMDHYKIISLNLEFFNFFVKYCAGRT